MQAVIENIGLLFQMNYANNQVQHANKSIKQLPFTNFGTKAAPSLLALKNGEINNQESSD